MLPPVDITYIAQEDLPGDAPDFFREAMGQMEALNYPPQVRALVQRYGDARCERRTLH